MKYYKTMTDFRALCMFGVTKIHLARIELATFSVLG